MTTAALLLSALPAVIPAFTETKAIAKNAAVSKGYDPNDCLKLRAYFETEAESGAKNGDKLRAYDYVGDYDGGEIDRNTYKPYDPET